MLYNTDKQGRLGWFSLLVCMWEKWANFDLENVRGRWEMKNYFINEIIGDFWGKMWYNFPIDK